MITNSLTKITQLISQEDMGDIWETQHRIELAIYPKRLSVDSTYHKKLIAVIERGVVSFYEVVVGDAVQFSPSSFESAVVGYNGVYCADNKS